MDKYCDKFELFALNNSFHITPEVRKLVTQEQNRKQAKPELKQDTDESFYEQQQKELDNQILISRNEEVLFSVDRYSDNGYLVKVASIYNRFPESTIREDAISSIIVDVQFADSSV